MAKKNASPKGVKEDSKKVRQKDSKKKNNSQELDQNNSEELEISDSDDEEFIDEDMEQEGLDKKSESKNDLDLKKTLPSVSNRYDLEGYYFTCLSNSLSCCFYGSGLNPRLYFTKNHILKIRDMILAGIQKKKLVVTLNFQQDEKKFISNNMGFRQKNSKGFKSLNTITYRFVYILLKNNRLMLYNQVYNVIEEGNNNYVRSSFVEDYGITMSFDSFYEVLKLVEIPKKAADVMSYESEDDEKKIDQSI